MKKQCVICNETVEKKDDYFKVDLFRTGKLVGTDQAHEECWKNRERFNNGIKQSLDDAIKLLRSSGITEGVQEMVIV